MLLGRDLAQRLRLEVLAKVMWQWAQTMPGIRVAPAQSTNIRAIGGDCADFAGDRLDAVALDQHIALEGGLSRPVDDLRVGEQCGRHDFLPSQRLVGYWARQLLAR